MLPCSVALGAIAVPSGVPVGVPLAVGSAVALAVAVVVLHNRLARARVRVEEAWAQVATDLQRRHDLVGPLVATVGAHAAHERAALEEVTAARARAVAAAAPAERATAEDALGDGLVRLLARTEAYPTLRADARFRELSAELTATEDRLAFARDFAVHRTARYEVLRTTFPSSLVARAFGFTPHATFVATPVARHAPTVEHGTEPGA